MDAQLTKPRRRYRLPIKLTILMLCEVSYEKNCCSQRQPPSRGCTSVLAEKVAKPPSSMMPRL
jgi:hypothetical protein